MMPALRLLADAGSTKTVWLLTEAGGTILLRCTTQGINPFMLTEDEVVDVLILELLPKLAAESVGEVRFFGAGCRASGIVVVEGALRRVFPNVKCVEVGSDLVGAARALFGTKVEGVACILGTGSNSGLYQGGKICSNLPPLGFVLGDEGSGAVLGRRLLGDVFKHQLPMGLCEAFFANYPEASLDEVMSRTYRASFPNRYLASFVPFLHHQRLHPFIHALLVEEFRRFFSRNVAAYARPDLPVGLVGSVAYFFADEIEEAASIEGFRVMKIMRSPLDGN